MLAQSTLVKLWLGLLALTWLLLLVGGVVSISRATAARAPEGCWYSEAQADEGAEVFARYCAACHGAELRGGFGPALAGPSFLRSWGGRPVRELYRYIRTRMPLNESGRLPPEEFLAVTGFVLAANGLPQGNTLVPGTACFETLVVPTLQQLRDGGTR